MVYPLFFLLNYPLPGLLGWTVFPLVVAACKRGWLGSVITVALCGAVLGLYVQFHENTLFSLAASSIQGRGPFKPHLALWLLETRGRPEDIEAIGIALRSMDWQAPESFGPPGDERRDLISILSRNPATAEKAADTLATMLLQNRSRQLAKFSARLLGDHGKIEGAPILLRYALEPAGPGRSNCRSALEAMGIPEVAQAILNDAMGGDIFVTGRVSPTIDPDVRSRLTKLLGRDAGPSYSQWYDAIQDLLDSRVSSLPVAIQAEMDREVACYRKYAIASNQRIMAQRAMPHIQAYMPKKPDYDAPTVELFERQVDAYAAAVDRAIREHSPQPAP